MRNSIRAESPSNNWPGDLAVTNHSRQISGILTVEKHSTSIQEISFDKNNKELALVEYSTNTRDANNAKTFHKPLGMIALMKCQGY